MVDPFDQLTTRAVSNAASAAGDTPETPTRKQEAQSDADAYTPRSIKEACLELLKYGLLEAHAKPNLYQVARTHASHIGRILEPLDLGMRVDEIRGLIFTVVASLGSATGEEDWAHPLVRRQRLNLEQSLLIALLRQQFIAHEQEAGLGTSAAWIAVEDVLPQLKVYLGDLGSDLQEEKRLRILLEQLKGYGIVSEVNEHDQVLIRPIIAHLANPESLLNLLQAIKSAAHRSKVRKSETLNEEPV
jgi:Domain of unknown function (DUF4194)